jgi:hypothetical protein
MVRLEKDTMISHTWIEIYNDKGKAKYIGEQVYKSTGRKRFLGGAIADARAFIKDKLSRGFYETGDINAKSN